MTDQAKTSTKINIAMVADWQYRIPLETTIKSIAFHNCNTNIYVLNPDIPREWFDHLNRSLKPIHDRVIDTKISIDDVKDQHVSRIQINVMASARLLLPRLLSCHRIIYLDSDLIVNQPLSNLFQYDLEKYPLAAACDIFDKSVFNSGVLVMDLDALRKETGLVERMLDFGKSPDLEDGDQTVLNHFFGQNFKPLPDADNLQVGLEANWDYIADYDTPLKSNYDHMERVLSDFNNAKIIHYVCPEKPWSVTSTFRYRDLWWQYFNLNYTDILEHHLPMSRPVQSQLLTYTYSDNLPQLEKLLPFITDVDLNLCAPSRVSTYLAQLIRFPNYHVYPRVLHYHLNKFIESCQIYLDINTGQKNLSLIQKLVDKGCPILSFESVKTPALAAYNNYHVFDDDQVEEFAKTIHQILKENQNESN